MILRDLRTQFKDTMPVSDGFFKLMQQTFGFYTSLCNDFFAALGSHVEKNTLSSYLQNEVRPRLFDKEHCRNIESIKKQFLAENIKLEQFVQTTHYDTNFINDLKGLKGVSEAIYELLQTHWEFFRYEKSVANNEAITAFILEIDRIGIRWDSYLEKYLAVSGVLKEASGEVGKEGFSSLLVQYHLPEDSGFTIEMTTTFIQFLQLTYEFIVKVSQEADQAPALEIATLEVGNPINCNLLVPTPYINSFREFLGYLSVDVLKRETLVKFVMEIVRLQQGKEIPKTAITNFQKKIAKQLDSLHPDGYLSINNEDAEDSVQVLTALCGEMDRLKIEYKDLMTGATDRLARNRTKPLSHLSNTAQHVDQAKPAGSPNGIVVPAPPAPGATPRESTVKIDVNKKEHIQYLTS